jgi:AAA-like domain
MIEQDLYKFSGCLPEEAATYVERDADNQLYNALKAGNFCYVLDSRQTGKSSLRVRIMSQLRKNGIACVFINLTSGKIQNVSPEQWYADQITEIIDNQDLKLNIDFNEWWLKHTITSDVKRFSIFISDVLLVQTNKNIVIFIDEIDSVLSLDFPTDDFFAFIRSCYEKRTENSEYNRLTFCLLGVASPNSLIKDKSRTPFNIGQAITLEPFQIDKKDQNKRSHQINQLEPLISGLKGKFSEPEKLMEEILDWTGGQPFLTQKLCDIVVKKSNPGNSSSVEQIVKSEIIDNWEFKDDPVHLQTIIDLLVRSKNEQQSFRLLNLYKKVLSEEDVKADNSSEQRELILSGIVFPRNGSLKVYNPIYENIFNTIWIERERVKLRLYIEEFENWKKADDRQKQLYLLYGQKFAQVWQWKEEIEQRGEDITSKESAFFDKSKEFWGKAQNSLPSECNHEAIIEAMKPWTGGLESFNDLIFEIANSQYKIPLEKGSEKKWVEDLIQSHLLEFCERQTIENLFLDDNDSKIEPFILLSTYREIWQLGKVDFDGSSEHEKLENMCLIIKKDNTLRILNRIYRLIFNLDWVEQKLWETRPYAKSFKAWEDSDRIDESLLLKDQDLERAIEWIQNKEQVNELEVEFIIRSLVWEMWQSAINIELQQEKMAAVDIIKKIRPKLKKKNNSPDTVIREILRWTKFHPLLVEALLQSICDGDTQIDQLLHCQNGVALELEKIQHFQAANLIDWISKGERERTNNLSDDLRNIISGIKLWIQKHEYLTRKIVNSRDPCQNLEEKIKIYFDREQNLLNYDIMIKGEFNRNSQESIQSSLDRIFGKEILKEEKIMAQDKLDALLSSIVEESSAIEAIAIVNLEEGTLEYCNKQLKSSKPEIYKALFGRKDVSDALGEFGELKGIPDALNTFGEATKYGTLEYSMFMLTEGILIAYFMDLPDLRAAICFIATTEANFASFVRQCRKKVDEIKKQLEDSIKN